MEEERVVRILVKLYNEFQHALIDAEKRGRGKYTDEDFNSLSSFMSFIHNNKSK